MKLRAALAATTILAFSAMAGTAWAKDDLVIGVAQFPSSLNPNIDSEVVKAYVLGFAIRPITAFDKDWKNSCLLCTELPTLANGLAKLEDQPDGKHGMAVTIKLKPDLKWGDGVPVTTKDLLFTWKMGINPASGFSNNNPWNRASRIDAVDDHTAVLHLSSVITSYNQWDQLLPEHIEGPVVAKLGDPSEYIKQTVFSRTPTTTGLWDGPYLITEYKSGAQVVFEPNPHWTGTKPGFKHIVIKTIENTSALQANLLSGDVDMVAGEGIGISLWPCARRSRTSSTTS